MPSYQQRALYNWPCGAIRLLNFELDMVTIHSKTFEKGWWTVTCTVVDGSITRSGTEYVEAAEDADDEDLKPLIAAKYALELP